MTDRPILFSAPMVRALLNGNKIQTRRLFKPQPTELGDRTCRINGHQGDTDYLMRGIAPRYWTKIKVGDRLWVREAWHAARNLDRTSPRDIPRDADIEHAATARSYAEIGLKGKLRPSIHMPRWASRLTLEVTDVRVERLQDISREDAIAEGIERSCPDVDPSLWKDYGSELDFDDPVLSYASLWDSINGSGAWNANTWVAAYTFKVKHQNIDEAH